jgi:ElaB/YqjD/DUF883 family membrane-anchored ribosome-binding protein
MADQIEHSDVDTEAPEQGGEETTTAKADGLHGLYDLSSTPEELRPYAEDLLAQVSKNVDGKFREHADFRKQWEPFEQLGIHDMDPDELQQLLTFRNDILSNPDALQEWLGAVAEHTGFRPELTQEDWIAYGDEKGFFDGNDGEEGDKPDTSIVDQIMSQLEERIAPIEQLMQEQRSESQVDAIRQQLESQLDDLEEKHGEYDRDAVVRLAHAFDAEGSEDPIEDAFQEYQRLRGTSQADLLDDKSGQPAAALSNGQADTAPEKFEGLDDPGLKDAVRRRLAASR